MLILLSNTCSIIDVVRCYFCHSWHVLSSHQISDTIKISNISVDFSSDIWTYMYFTPSKMASFFLEAICVKLVNIKLLRKNFSPRLIYRNQISAGPPSPLYLQFSKIYARNDNLFPLHISFAQIFALTVLPGRISLKDFNSKTKIQKSLWWKCY